MDTIKKLLTKYKQFLLFCIVGVANTVVALLVYWLVLKLFEIIGVSFSLGGFDVIAGISSGIGNICGAINSYILNSKFVFEEKNKHTGIKFIIAFIIYLVLDAMLVMLVEKVFNVPNEYCKLIVTPIMLIENFFINKLWVFKEENKGKYV